VTDRTFLLGAGLLLLLLAGYIFAPFLGALLAAASVALVLAPIHGSWAGRVPRHPTAAAAILTGLVCLLLAVPFVLGGWALLNEAEAAYPAAKAWINGLSETGLPLLPSLPPWMPKIDPKAIVLENLDQVSSWAGTAAQAVVRNAVFIGINFAVFTAALFLFLRDGERMVRGGSELIPLPEATKANLFARVRGVLLAVANGIFAVALLQGTLAWVGFALFRVPFSFLLGGACVLLSPIPFVGSALVWVPVVAYTALQGATGKAAALALWFVVVVGLSDNVVRPILLGAQTKLPIPLVFVGVIGALKAFGLAGLFIGPLTVALAIGFIEILRERRGA
jgi:predicted PurR-regulated permease PerM